MISPKIRIKMSKLKAAFDRFSRSDKKAILEKVVRTDAMGFVRDIVAITPPGSSGAPLASGSRGEKAVQRGEAKIAGDLRRIFAPLADGLIARAMENQKSLIDGVKLWATKDGKFYGVERSQWQPEASQDAMRDHHRRYFKRGKMTRARTKTRDVGRWKFIDKMVVKQSTFDEYLTTVRAKMGILAGGWAFAAKKLKVRMTRIAKRQASGDCDIIMGTDSFRVRMENTVPYASDADLKRRADWVLDSRKRAKRLKNRIKVEIEAKMKAQLKKV